MSQGVVLLKLAGDRSGSVGEQRSLCWSVLQPHSVQYGTQLSYRVLYSTLQYIQYCTVATSTLHYNGRVYIADVIMQTSFSMSHAREQPLIEWYLPPNNFELFDRLRQNSPGNCSKQNATQKTTVRISPVLASYFMV